MLNETHDPSLRSWVGSANTEDTEFPIQNLPFGVFRSGSTDVKGQRIGVAIGDEVLDLRATSAAGVLGNIPSAARQACEENSLNALMRQGPRAWASLRLALSGLLREGSAARATLEPFLVPQRKVEMGLPAAIGDFTDFFASLHHATRAGATVRPDQPVFPNYEWVPIAYHGRSSSIRTGPVKIRRPRGQTRVGDEGAPTFGPSTRLDYEAELGFFVGPGNELGEPIPIDDADDHIFGLCLLNDWSARDIQSWESKPLGPFLAKNFATVISPWLVTWEALRPFRVSWNKAGRDVLPYLNSSKDEDEGGIDIQVDVYLQSALMRRDGLPRSLVSSTSTKHCYWTLAQMVAHHTSNGCNLMPGDLIGTGTQSGPGLREAGCLLEMTASGKLQLPNGEERTFVEDGDTIALSGRCSRPGFRSIGFGESVTTVLSNPR